MTPPFRIKQATAIIFVFLLLATLGCVSSTGNMSNADSIRAAILKYPKYNADTVEKSIYTFIKNKQYDEAIEQCEKLREIRPDDHDVYWLEGHAYQQKGDLSSSIERFSKLILLDNTRRDIYYARSKSYLWSKQYEKALNDLEKIQNDEQAPAQVVKAYEALGINGVTTAMVKGFLFHNKAQTLAGLGEVNAAIESIDRAIEYYPTYGQSYELRGGIYLYQQKYSLAYIDFKKAVEIDPNVARLWNSMGLINFLRGNYDEALSQYQKGNQLEPEELVLLTNMSIAYWLQGHQVKAFETMGKVLRRKALPEPYYHYAYFYHLKGDQNKAQKNFKKAQELNPDILERRASLIERVPESSPTRKFYQDQLRAARSYIGAGRTAAAAVNGDQVPTLGIESLVLDPDPVPVNRPFDFRLKFKADIPASAGSEIETLFYFKVLQNNKTLFTSESYPLKVKNGKMSTRVQNMNPVPVKGVYTIKVFINHRDLLADKSIELIIK